MGPETGGAVSDAGRSGGGRAAFDPAAGTGGRPAPAYFHRAAEQQYALQPCGYRHGVFYFGVLADAEESGRAVLSDSVADYRITVKTVRWTEKIFGTERGQNSADDAKAMSLCINKLCVIQHEVYGDGGTRTVGQGLP
jgi:hypothetical protein